MKYILPVVATFIIGLSVYAFQPATLFVETWDGIDRKAVYTEEDADELFSQGWLLEEEQFLGTSITTISGSDTMSNFPTTYNANLNALNAGKMEISTTTLPLVTTLAGLTTIGTIGTGVWQATDVGVAYGGTGSSTLSLGQVLLGSSTNAVAVVGGFGTSGQFLTSNGASLAPSWQTSSVNQNDAYAWTNTHSFSATSTQATTTIAWMITESGYMASSTLASTTINQLNLAGADANVLVTGATTDASALHYHSNVCTSGQASQAINTTGNQTVGHNLGVTPTNIIIKAVADNDTWELMNSYGTATSTASESSTHSSSNIDTSAQTVGQTAGQIILLKDADGTTEAAASLGSWNTTNFVLAWGTNNNVGGVRYFQWTVCK